MAAMVLRHLADLIENGKTTGPVIATQHNQIARWTTDDSAQYEGHMTGRCVLVLDYQDAEMTRKYAEWLSAHPGAIIMPMRGEDLL
jgi:hypothetical protein